MEKFILLPITEEELVTAVIEGEFDNIYSLNSQDNFIAWLGKTVDVHQINIDAVYKKWSFKDIKEHGKEINVSFRTKEESNGK